MSILRQIAALAPTACGIRVGTTVRAVGDGGKDVTGVITRIRLEDGGSQVTVNNGPLSPGRSYGTTFTQGRATFTAVSVPGPGALLVIEDGTEQVVGISYSQKGAYDWIAGNFDESEFKVALF